MDDWNGGVKERVKMVREPIGKAADFVAFSTQSSLDCSYPGSRAGTVSGGRENGGLAS